MEIRLRIIAVVVSVGLFVLIIDLVRRKKLGEELSWLWLLAGVMLVVTATLDSVYLLISRVTGIVTPTSIVFFFGIVFLLLVCLQLSIKLSENRNQVKNLAQKLALFENELRAAKAELERLRR